MSLIPLPTLCAFKVQSLFVGLYHGDARCCWSIDIKLTGWRIKASKAFQVFDDDGREQHGGKNFQKG
jgi:hypothetical protein